MNWNGGPLNETSSIFTGRVLIVALDGWTDAGSGSTGSANYIKDKLNCERLLQIDDSEYFDYLRQRPVIVLDEHGDRDFFMAKHRILGSFENDPEL